MPEIILSRNFTLSLEMVRPWLQLRHTKNEEWRRLISDLVAFFRYRSSDFVDDCGFRRKT